MGSCRYYAAASYFFHTIDNLSLPAGTLRTFTFNVITGTMELKYAILLAVFHLFHLGAYFLPCFVLNVLNSTLSSLLTLLILIQKSVLMIVLKFTTYTFKDS